MKKIVIAIVVLTAMGAFPQAQTPAQPQAPPTVTKVMDSQLKNLEREFVPAAEAMPEDKYNFAPSPSAGEFKGVRTFAQQVKHVAAVQYMIASAILGEKSPVELGGENGPDSMTSKADIVKFLKDSFEYSHKALASVTDQNATSGVQNPFGKGTTPRLGLASVLAWHGFDHYGQMAVYLRMNGVVPPASRGQ